MDGNMELSKSGSPTNKAKPKKAKKRQGWLSFLRHRPPKRTCHQPHYKRLYEAEHAQRLVLEEALFVAEKEMRRLCHLEADDEKS